MTLYWQVPWPTQRSLDIDLLVSTRHKLGAMGLPFGSPQAHTNTYKHVVAPTGPWSHTCQNRICPGLPLIVAECANPIGSALPVHSSIGLRIMSDSSDKLLERSALIIDGICSKSNGWDHNCIHHGNMWGTCEGDSKCDHHPSPTCQKMKFDHGWRGSTLPYFAKIPQ